jgi:hypothetical protein
MWGRLFQPQELKPVEQAPMAGQEWQDLHNRCAVFQAPLLKTDWRVSSFFSAQFCFLDSTKVRHFHTFFDIIFGSPCHGDEIVDNDHGHFSSWFGHGWRKVRHAFWPQNPLCTYVAACKLAASADRKRDEQLLSETPGGSKALAQRAPEA